MVVLLFRDFVFRNSDCHKKALSHNKINSILAFWPFDNFDIILRKLTFNCWSFTILQSVFYSYKLTLNNNVTISSLYSTHKLREREEGRERRREGERERERELQMLNKRIFLILDTIRYSYIIILYISNVDFQFAALSSFTIPISACKASE